MICAWNELLGILPPWLREQTDYSGKNTVTEIRLRSNAPPELISGKGSQWMERIVTKEDIQFCINTASRYSPWSATTASHGYITAPGGHRIGICGEAVYKDDGITGIREISSVCIRVARDFPGISKNITKGNNILILGAPGWGKTTLLRDLIRSRAEKENIAVADEREELFPSVFMRGKKTDILTGAPKAQALEQLIRTMSPECIAMDEITAEADCMALQRAAFCGVKIMATAHASSLNDYLSRTVYKPLHRMQLFDTIVVLHPDKTFRIERMEK